MTVRAFAPEAERWPYRVAEYRDWAARRPDDARWELIDGVPVPMSPAEGRHRRIVTNLIESLDNLTDHRGCCAYPGLAIPSEAMDDSALVIDRGRKTEFHRTVPSLAVLMLVHQDEARVEVWRRAPDWTVQVAGPGAVVDLPERGGTLPVAEIHARLTL